MKGTESCPQTVSTAPTLQVGTTDAPNRAADWHFVHGLQITGRAVLPTGNARIRPGIVLSGPLPLAAEEFRGQDGRCLDFLPGQELCSG